MSRRTRCTALLLATAFAGAGRSVSASDLERALEGRLRGAWAIATVEVYSDCAGFYTNDHVAAGIEAMRSWWETKCSSLVAASFSPVEQAPPKEHGSDRSWTQGFHDGQELAFNLLLVDRLRACLVPAPSLPAGVQP